MFNDVQVSRLIELVRADESKLFPTSFNKWNRSESRRAWSQIAGVFNSEFPNETKTAEQIRIKWKNMRQRAREVGQSGPIVSRSPTRSNENEGVLGLAVDSKSLGLSIAHVLGALNSTVHDEAEVKWAREASVPSCSSGGSGNDRLSRSVNISDSSRPSRAPVIITGSPIFPAKDRPVMSTKRRRPINKSASGLDDSVKRRRQVDDDRDRIKGELLEIEMSNARKLALVLDEALCFLRRLNSPNDRLSEKIHDLLNNTH